MYIKDVILRCAEMSDNCLALVVSGNHQRAALISIAAADYLTDNGVKFSFTKQSRMIRFENGSKVIFTTASCEKSADSLRGLSPAILIIDFDVEISLSKLLLQTVRRPDTMFFRGDLL